MNKKILQKFVLDPEWDQMSEYIFTHFERSASIEDIDISLDSSVVHAEVIARQQIQSSLDRLRGSFDAVKPEEDLKKVSFR